MALKLKHLGDAPLINFNAPEVSDAFDDNLENGATLDFDPRLLSPEQQMDMEKSAEEYKAELLRIRETRENALNILEDFDLDFDSWE